jgi:hypothetical protein
MDDEEDVYGYEWAVELGKMWSPTDLQFAAIKLLGITAGRYLALLVCPIAAVVFLYLSYRASAGSFGNALYLELSSGCAFFAAAPLVIQLGRRRRWQVPVAGVVVSAVLSRDLRGARVRSNTRLRRPVRITARMRRSP